jgi:hypothetical protein
MADLEPFEIGVESRLGLIVDWSYTLLDRSAIVLFLDYWLAVNMFKGGPCMLTFSLVHNNGPEAVNLVLVVAILQFALAAIPNAKISSRVGSDPFENLQAVKQCTGYLKLVYQKM